MKRWLLGIPLALVLALAYCNPGSVRGEETPKDLPASMHSGALVHFEIWQWTDDEASHKKLMDLADGDQVPGSKLPWDGIQFRFRVPVEHDSVTCTGRSTTNFERSSWGPEPVKRDESRKSLYRLSGNPLIPVTGRYALEIEAKNQGAVVAHSTINFDIVRPRQPRSEGLLGVGSTRKFPKAMQSGTPVEFELWQWNDNNPAEQKQVAKLDDGVKIPYQSLPKGEMRFRFRIPVKHDTVQCAAYSSDCFDRIGWGPEKIEDKEPAERHLYRLSSPGAPFQVSRYCLVVEAKSQGETVARRVLHFEIVSGAKVPRNTTYLKGKKDNRGNPITWSKPVELGGLNETPKLKDNDYAFEPQHAYNVINYERFPPFHLPERFLAAWASRRFTDEAKFGSPLNRGFTTVQVCGEIDNLPIAQRTNFTYPGLLVNIINDGYKEDPKQWADLKPWAEFRSGFCSKEHAIKLGYKMFEGWGAGGYQPFNPGLFGWDEEEMWPTKGIGTRMVKEHPEGVPASLRELRKKDPELKSPDSQAMIDYWTTKAWGDFVGYGYRGARQCAAEQHRTIKIWHYGSMAPGNALFMWDYLNSQINPDTGKYRCEELGGLSDWFKCGDRVSFEASEYARQIDYFHKDFYFHTVFPHKVSMYQKDPGGQYVLDEKGRRKIRRDVFEETVYVAPTKMGYDDGEVSANYFKGFLGKGENALYWFNGAKYYKKHGTAITDKQLVPAIRKGNQETWGEEAKFGSRPVNPYLAEATPIFTFMMGLEGLFFWDCPSLTAAGQGPKAKPDGVEVFGDTELLIKGMHRVSQFNRLFEGEYYYVRPFCPYEFLSRDHPVIRGIINGRYLVLAMTNPYLDPGEAQQVELWYDAPYGQKEKIWSDTVTLQARKTHLFQCKLPKLAAGKEYDPDKLYLCYTCVDGKYRQTYMQTGNYTVKYPYPADVDKAAETAKR